MKDHIKYLCEQAGKKFNALARIARFLDENKQKLLMNSFTVRNASRKIFNLGEDIANS